MAYISRIERIGRREERYEIIRDLLVSRFGSIDEELGGMIEPLTELSTAEFSRLMLPLSTLSREELISRFGACHQFVRL